MAAVDNISKHPWINFPWMLFNLNNTGCDCMAKEYAKPFYNSKAWKKCRESYIKSLHDGLCEHCLKNGKCIPGYIVDHIVEITPENINNSDITLNFDNLQYLCLECHNTKTFGIKKEVLREGLMFDESGNLVEIYKVE